MLVILPLVLYIVHSLHCDMWATVEPGNLDLVILKHLDLDKCDSIQFL